MADMAAAGKLSPSVYEVFPLEEAVSALAVIAARQVIGKVVLST